MKTQLEVFDDNNFEHCEPMYDQPFPETWWDLRQEDRYAYEDAQEDLNAISE